MRPEEPRALDTHVHIDLADHAQVKEVADILDATPEELSAAVEKVGTHPVAVAIFLERPDAV